LDSQATGVAVSESPWRKLSEPYEILPATERSQAVYGLRFYGQATAEAMRFHFGVGRAMLDALVAEGIAETAKNADGVDWWRLKEPTP
jgi:hypothetical protein